MTDEVLSGDRDYLCLLDLNELVLLENRGRMQSPKRRFLNDCTLLDSPVNEISGGNTPFKRIIFCALSIRGKETNSELSSHFA